MDTKDLLDGGWKKQGRAVLSVSERTEPVQAEGDSLQNIAAEISACSFCGLSAGRNMPVPGAGAAAPRVMFIGEGPGAEEDRTGLPFVGAAGQYLDKWLAAIGLSREKDCFIGNIIKCRPPGNRDPRPDEISACRPYLKRQLEVLRPGIIITLGRFASQVICDSEEGIGRLRGRVHEYEGIPVVATYHPSAVLRNPELRKNVWEDLKKAKDLLEGMNG